MKFKTAFSAKKRYQLDFFDEESLTHQSFADDTNINNILDKYKQTGLIDHVNQHNGQYGDFSNVADYQSALESVMAANDSFESLPSSVRKRFDNDPAKFLEFATDENNRAEMHAMGLLKPEIVLDQKMPDSPKADPIEE